MPMTRLLLAPTLLLLLVPLAPAAGAEGDTAWAREGRQLEVDSSDLGFSFTSKRASALGQDTMTGVFDTPTATLALALRTEEPEAASVRLDATWQRVVEFRDLDGDGRYGLADETVQELDLVDLESRTTTSTLLAGGHVATAQYHLPHNESGSSPVVGGLPVQGGTLRLSFGLRPYATDVRGLVLDATAIGLGLEVDRFPFLVDDSRLAVVVALASDAPQGVVGPTSLVAQAGNLSWSAAWRDRAAANGAETGIGWSSLSSDSTHAAAVLSLPRGDTVSHDGSMAASRESFDFPEDLALSPPGDWRFYAAGLAAVALVMGIPSWRRLREA